MIRIDYSLSKRVYDYIIENLISGRLHLGEKITEEFIANQVGISRGPVREAFKQLTKDRLINCIPRSGCYVTSLDQNEIDEIYQIRKKLECLALESGFHNFFRKKLLEFKKTLEAFHNNIYQVSLDDLLKFDHAFHDYIFRQSNAQTVISILETLQIKIDIFRHKGKYSMERRQASIQEHLAIIQALIDNQLNDALNALNDHLENSRRYCHKRMCRVKLNNHYLPAKRMKEKYHHTN